MASAIPQNIGAIARTAAFYGLDRIVLSGHPSQSGLADTAYRVAKGGLERLEIWRARHLPDTLREIGGLYHVVGTATGKGMPLEDLAKGVKPIALVLGNEEEGLGPATLAACHAVISLRGSGRVQSLNVSATAAILIHEMARREG